MTQSSVKELVANNHQSRASLQNSGGALLDLNSSQKQLVDTEVGISLQMSPVTPNPVPPSVQNHMNVQQFQAPH